MEVRQCVLLMFAVLCFSVCAEGQQNCKSGSQCFPDGKVPDGLSPTDELYYCCLEKNTVRQSDKTAYGTVNCTCKPDFTLEQKIQKWAEDTKNNGRMCNRGAAGCSGSQGSSTINNKFISCCWPREMDVPHSAITIFDLDKEEYIGCRCSVSIPSPDPTAYAVPQTSLYNSTGEVCSYDKGCEDRPALRCTSPGVTFCCYGSRGIVTDNDGDNFTRCTCTNQVYGEMCETAPVPIRQPDRPCLTNCSNRGDNEVCEDSAGNKRCCEPNRALSATVLNGIITDCTCTTERGYYCVISHASSSLESPSLLLVMLLTAAVMGQWVW